MNEVFSLRKPIVGISFKNYINSIRDACYVVEQFDKLTGKENEIDQVIFPSLGTIYPVSAILKDSNIAVGAQNISPAKEGAYTGEISISSIIDMGGRYVEIGHAERRIIFKETQKMINEKVKLTLELGLIPFLCIGEEVKFENLAQIRGDLEKQILESLVDVSPSLISNIVLAYEPVWAIGQQESADHSYVHHSHDLIRDILNELYGETVAKKVRIIYGGSVSKNNVSKLVNSSNVDGVFVGRFGHLPLNYKRIVDIVKEQKENSI